MRKLGLALSSERWRLGGFGFLLAIVVFPGSPGFSILGRLMVAAILPWLILPLYPRTSLSWRCLPLAVFIGWMSLSALWSPAAPDAIWGLFQLFIASGFFLLGVSSKNAEPFYVGLAMGVPIAMALGWFDPNYDLGGEAAAVAAVGLATFGNPLALIPLGAVAVAHSKGAVLGLLAATLFGFRSWLGRGMVLCGGMALVGFKIYSAPEAAASFAERWNIWRDTWAGVSWFGHGLDSFFTAYQWTAVHQDIVVRPVEHAHNDFLEILFEQGYVGGALAPISLACLLVGQTKSVSGLVLICICGIGLVGFPLHNPITMVVAAFAVGRLCSERMVYVSRPLRGSDWTPENAARIQRDQERPATSSDDPRLSASYRS